MKLSPIPVPAASGRVWVGQPVQPILLDDDQSLATRFAASRPCVCSVPVSGFRCGRGDIRFENAIVLLSAILFPGIDLYDVLITGGLLNRIALNPKHEAPTEEQQRAADQRR